jgi:hypothetical protein
MTIVGAGEANDAELLACCEAELSAEELFA